MIKKIKEEPKIPEPTSHNKFDTDDCLEYVVLGVCIHHLVNKIPIDNGRKLTGIKIKI